MSKIDEIMAKYESKPENEEDPKEQQQILEDKKTGVDNMARKKKAKKIEPEERDELNLEDLKPAKTKEMKDDQDYCGKCHSSGTLTEITKDQEKCPKCGAELDWE